MSWWGKHYAVTAANLRHPRKFSLAKSQRFKPYIFFALFAPWRETLILVAASLPYDLRISKPGF
jgi:hypothetical protein